MDLGPQLVLASLDGAVTAAVLALTALGLSLVFGVMRVVNVAHGEFFMLGAVIAWFVATYVGGLPAVGFVAALVLAPLVVGAVAASADWLILKRLNYEPEATIVATIGLLYILQQGALVTFGPVPRAVEPPFNHRIEIPWFEGSDVGWGLFTTSYKLFVISAAIAVLIAVWVLLSRTKIGLVMRATQLDRETAQAFGIPVEKVYALTFGFGAALAALAAVLIVPIQQADYLMGGDPLLLSFIVVIIGGLGSVRGTLIAALLIGMSDGIISVFFTPTLAKIIATLLVALVLVFRPQGLFGDADGMKLDRVLALHLLVIAALFALQFILPDYHQGNLARILVLATFATGFNILFGYTGLLSLGHALFFAAGMYGAAMPMRYLDIPAELAFPAGILAATALSALVGVLALRTTGVAFMIVTLMFAQAGYLTLLYFNPWTRGDEGFVIPQADRVLFGFDLSSPDVRFTVAWIIFSVGLLIALAIVRSQAGRVLVAIRENEERTRLLGFNPLPYKLGAVIASGAFAGAAGAGYALLFGSVGASFAAVQYSIEPLLFVLLGGAGVVLGPLVGSVLMFYLIEYAREVTSAYLIVVGVALVLLILFARQGVLGTVRARLIGWLP